MTERDASLLGKFFDNLSFSPHKERNNNSAYFGNSPYTYTIRVNPKEIEARCGREVINFVMRNLVVNGDNTTKGNFFGYRVKLDGYRDCIEGNYMGEKKDYFKIKMSETGYKSLEEEMYNTDDDDDD